MDDAEALLELLASYTICGAGRAGRHLGLGPLNVLGIVATADDETTAYTAAPAMRPAAVPLRTEVR